MNNPFTSPAQLQRALDESGYVCDTPLATALFLAMALERPLFLEGEAGVGKTELAKAASAVLGRPLVRLQCYEGLDSRSALYEWNYPKQILHIRMMEALRGTGVGPEPDRQLRVGWEGVHPDALFTEPYLLARPLLSAIRPDGPAPVLLIDEVDRSDEAFEAFLLEVLAEYQVTIPELGTIRAAEPPLIVLTSNRTREVHDALKRRCFYHWLDFPSFEKERAIVERLVPGLGRDLATDVTAFVQRLRQEPLFKRPGLAETVNWAAALEQLGVRQLNPAEVEATIGCLLKYRDDLDLMLQPADGGLSTLQRTLAELGVPRGSAG